MNHLIEQFDPQSWRVIEMTDRVKNDHMQLNNDTHCFKLFYRCFRFKLAVFLSCLFYFDATEKFCCQRTFPVWLMSPVRLPHPRCVRITWTIKSSLTMSRFPGCHCNFSVSGYIICCMLMWGGRRLAHTVFGSQTTTQ